MLELERDKLQRELIRARKPTAAEPGTADASASRGASMPPLPNKTTDVRIPHAPARITPTGTLRRRGCCRLMLRVRVGVSVDFRAA